MFHRVQFKRMFFQEFFKATEDGSVEQLEKLFYERANANPNMTRVKRTIISH